MSRSRAPDETGCSSRNLNHVTGNAPSRLLSQRISHARKTPSKIINARNEDGILEVVEALMELPQSPISKTSTKRPVCEESASRVCQPRLALVNEFPTSYGSAQFHGALPATPAEDNSLRYLPSVESSDHMRMSRKALLASTDHCAHVKPNARHKSMACGNYPVRLNMPAARSHVDTEALERPPPTFYLDCEGYGMRQPHYHGEERTSPGCRSESPAFQKAILLQEASGAIFRQSLSTPCNAASVDVAPCHLDFHGPVDDARYILTGTLDDAGATSKLSGAFAHRRTEKILEHRDWKPVNENLEPWRTRTLYDLKNEELDSMPYVVEPDAQKGQVTVEHYGKLSTHTPYACRRVSVVEPETEDDRSCAMFTPASKVAVKSLLAMDDAGNDKLRGVFAIESSNSCRAAYRQVSPEPPFGSHVTKSQGSNMLNRGVIDPQPRTAKIKPGAAKGSSHGVFQQAGLLIPQRRSVQSRARSSLAESAETTLAQQCSQSLLPSPSSAPVTLAENFSVTAFRKRSEAAKSPGTVTSPRMRKCNCRNSKCLKLYCDCFACGNLCDGCNCVNCHNTDYRVVERQRAIQDILEKNPRAFDKKITSAKSHSSGCHCKKSRCLKRYCECFQGSIHCGLMCKCCQCENYPGSRMLAQRRESVLLVKAQETLMPKIDVLSHGVMQRANVPYTGCV